MEGGWVVNMVWLSGWVLTLPLHLVTYSVCFLPGSPGVALSQLLTITSMLPISSGCLVRVAIYTRPLSSPIRLTSCGSGCSSVSAGVSDKGAGVQVRVHTG